VTATGAHYVRAHSAARMYDCVREAFHVARHERRPAVLGVPYDLQKLPLPGSPDYVTSSSFVPKTGRMPPDPDMLGRLVERLASAQRPVIVAGRGAVRSGAQAAIEELAEKSGALLATTLPARGLFDHNPYSIGVAGGFASEIARELFAQSDLAVAIGASLTYYTVDGGALFPQAFVAQIDEQPRGLKDGMRAAGLFVRADARAGAEAAARELARGGAIFGRTDFGAIARGFSLRGTTVADIAQFGALMREYEAQGTAEIWNVPISDQVTSPTMRRLKAKGHGVM